MESMLLSMRGCCSNCPGLIAGWADEVPNPVLVEGWDEEATYSQIREHHQEVVAGRGRRPVESNSPRSFSADPRRGHQDSKVEGLAALQAMAHYAHGVWRETLAPPGQCNAAGGPHAHKAAHANSKQRGGLPPEAAPRLAAPLPSDGRQTQLEPQPTLQALQGRWVHKAQHPSSSSRWRADGSLCAEDEVVELIRGDKVEGPDGCIAHIRVESAESIILQQGMEVHTASLVGNKLFWADGDIWTRAEESASWCARWPHQQLEQAPPQAKSSMQGRENSRLHVARAAVAPSPRANSRPLPGDVPLDPPVLSPAPATSSQAAAAAIAAAPEAAATAATQPLPKAPPLPQPRPQAKSPNSASPQARAVSREAALLEVFKGRWRHKHDPSILELIKGDRIQGADGTVTKIKLQGSTAFAIELNGSTHFAELVNEELLWDDGDVWFRDLRPYAFNGRWTHKSNHGVVEVVRGDVIHGPDGTLTQLKQKTDDSFTIKLGGQTYTAQLVGDQLVWDDGDIWLRGGAFDGRWAHRANPMIKEVIKGDTIHRPNGIKLQLKAEGEEKFQVCIGGAIRRAHMVENELVWDDGSIWVLFPDQTYSEMEENEFDQASWIAEVRKLSMEHEECLATLDTGSQENTESLTADTVRAEQPAADTARREEECAQPPTTDAYAEAAPAGQPTHDVAAKQEQVQPPTTDVIAAEGVPAEQSTDDAAKRDEEPPPAQAAPPDTAPAKQPNSPAREEEVEQVEELEAVAAEPSETLVAPAEEPQGCPPPSLQGPSAEPAGELREAAAAELAKALHLPAPAPGGNLLGEAPRSPRPLPLAEIAVRGGRDAPAATCGAPQRGRPRSREESPAASRTMVPAERRRAASAHPGRERSRGPPAASVRCSSLQGRRL